MATPFKTDSPLVQVEGEGMKIKIKGKHFGGASYEDDEITDGAKLKQIASLAFGGIDLLSPQFNVEWKCTLDGAHCSENFEIQVDLPEGQGGLHELSLEVGGQKLASPRMGWTMKNQSCRCSTIPCLYSRWG